jgi:methylmalonyl-CoA/ethylmalonyl-CoA epimerase
VHDTLGSLALHHVGIVVNDLNAAVATYEALGFSGGERFTMTAQGIEAVTFKAGPGYVELISPTDPEGPIAKFLAKRGDTVHHVAFSTPDIEHALATLQTEGIRLIDTTPRTGAHGWKIAFIHPESCNGVLVELVQDEEADHL